MDEILVCVAISSAVVEWMPTQGRTVAGILLGYSFTMGQLVLAGIAYLIRPWRWLQLAVSAPFLIFFLYSWYVQQRRQGEFPVCGPRERSSVHCQDLLDLVGTKSSWELMHSFREAPAKPQEQGAQAVGCSAFNSSFVFFTALYKMKIKVQALRGSTVDSVPHS